jgi:hypothetical protein
MAVTQLKHSHYHIFIRNEDDTVSELFRKEGRCTTHSGRERQLNRVTNETVEAIRDVRGWKRITVQTMTPVEVSQQGLR